MSNIISRLKSGISYFSAKNCMCNSHYNQVVRKGQSPKVMVIGCSDSLVDPLSLMGAEIGELFVHRNIAALVPPYQPDEGKKYLATSATLEHGVLNLKVSHLIVMGHGYCGGIKALMENPLTENTDGFIQSWVRLAQHAKERVLQRYPNVTPEMQRELCEKESILISLQNLRTFPWIKEKESTGDLQLHGWHFNQGVLSIYNAEKNTFEPEK